MARQERDGQARPISDGIRDLAERLAAEHECSVDRTLICLTRLAEAFPQADAPLCPTEFGISLLECALCGLGTANGLELIESADLGVLANRVQAVEILADEFSPFYTHGELQDHLEQFVCFCEQTRDFLVATGLPQKTFSPSPWLHLQLGRLYDVRCTSSPYPRESAGEPYRWIKRPGWIYMLGEATYCTYEEASFLPWISKDDALRLERSRDRVFAARHAVLEELVAACNERQCDGVLEHSLNALSKHLDNEGIEFLLRMDSHYMGGNSRRRNAMSVTPAMSPGGVTNLLEVVGHVEQELRTKRYHSVKDDLPPEVVQRLSCGESDYFQIVSQFAPECLDAALDAFCENLAPDYWDEFCIRFSKWLDPGFRVVLSLPVEPRDRKFLSQLLPLFVAEIEEKAAREESRFGPASTSASNVMRYDAGSWTITFDGKTIARPHKVGYYFIAQILRCGDRDISPVKLVQSKVAWEAGQSLRSKTSSNCDSLSEDSMTGDLVMDSLTQNELDASPLIQCSARDRTTGLKT